MSLDLPISLVLIDNVAHELSRMAIESSLQQITPAQILIFTDHPSKIPISGAEYHHFDGNYDEAMSVLWYEVPQFLSQEHWLWIQWDSWVLNAKRWTDEFLSYDYIGAPWPVEHEHGNTWYELGYRKGSAVGNGGFSLRSTKLAECLALNPEHYIAGSPEDDRLCRLYRSDLEAEGFKWATEDLAARFSIEYTALPPERTFGFHGIHNWSWAISEDACDERLSKASPFVKKGRAYREFSEWWRTKKMTLNNGNMAYDPAVFNVNSLEKAKAIILTPDGVRTSEERWNIETEYLYNLIEEYATSRDLTCLDYGCGVGRLVKPLIEWKHWTVIGVDISPSMRGFASQYVDSSDFVCCSPVAFDVMVRLGVQVDFAIAVWALQHVADIENVLEKIKQCLKPSGKLFVMNAECRFIPTKERWVTDNVDVWKLLGEKFMLIKREETDPNVIASDPKSFWAVYEKC